MSSYPLERVERQLSWVADRPARDRARLLVAAIEKDFGPPVRTRLGSEREIEPAPGARD